MYAAANALTPDEAPSHRPSDAGTLAGGAFPHESSADRPLSRSYWVRPGRLLAGCYPGDIDPEEATAKLSRLLHAGVTHFVNLMEEREHDFLGRLFADYRPLTESLATRHGQPVVCLRRPIPDMSAPSTETMRETLDRLDATVQSGGVPYVHCLAGKGRTGTVMGCYLVRHGLTGTEALQRLRELTAHRSDVFWPTPQTSVQREFVLNWKPGQ